MTKKRDKILKEVLWAAELDDIKTIDEMPIIEYAPSEKFKQFLKKKVNKIEGRI